VKVQAYILIQTEVGKAAQVAKVLSELPGITHAEDITGPYDVIVRAEADDMDQLTTLVTGRMHPIDGLTRTITCPVVHL
jgi:DNA-binding Lrp family transcriptional regulator